MLSEVARHFLRRWFWVLSQSWLRVKLLVPGTGGQEKKSKHDAVELR